MTLRLAAVLFLFCALGAGAQQIEIVTDIGVPADARPGAERWINILFHNRDTRPATNGAVIVRAASIVELRGPGWVCEDAARRASATCRRDQIAPGELVSLSALVTIPQGTHGSTGVSITADQFIRQPDSFPIYSINPAAPTADLGISVTSHEEPPGERPVLTLTASVVNRGPATAQNVVLRLTGEELLPPLGASGSGWTCRVARYDTICTRPSLAAGETATVDFRHYVSFVQSASGVVFDLTFAGADANALDNQLVFRATASIPPPPDPASFEPVLLPIALLDIAGAFGSLWRTHFTLFNGNDEPLIGQGAFDLAYPFYSNCLFPICPWLHSIPARSGSTLYIQQPGGPPGVLLWVRKDRAAKIDYELRVQDMSRQALTWGTEIPVVREKDLRTAPFRLVNVPLDDRFRQALRIYDVSANDSAAVLVRFIDAEVDRVMHEQVLTLTVAPALDPGIFSAFRLFPGYAEIGWVAALPELRDSGRVHIELVPLTPESRIWAFVSVTNNETQHVTTISPR